MKRILYLLFLLSLPFVAFAQYPNAPNKIVLGRQTTGDGLIFRTNGQPSWTPANAANAWMALDTTTGNLWTYRAGEWFLEVPGDLRLVYPLVINKSGVNIKQGQPVMIDTVQLVQGDQVRVRPAIATVSNSQFIMGVASTDINNDATGYVSWFGYVREVDHADIAQTGVTLDVGDILYISATEAGRYTDTEPAAPNVNATIALVVRKPNANNITLLVRPWLNEKLGDLRDVDLAGLQTGDGIKWNGTKWVAGQFAGADSTIVSAGYGIDVSEVSNNFTVSADTNELATPYDVSLKQDKLTGTGLVKSTSGTISYITDNSTNWDAAYNDRIISAAFSGSGTKTLTLTQQDAGTVTASFTDLQGVTSVTAGTGLSGGTITTTGTISADTSILSTKWYAADTASGVRDWVVAQGYTSNVGTVTSIATNNGITGGTITTTGTIGLTGQALALHNLSTNGLIARTGAGTVAGRTITAGTGISVTNGDGVSGNPTVTNSAPDQVVSITGAGINSVTGTYPNFTITATEVDGSTTNELQTLSASSNQITLSNSGGSVTIAGAGINTVGTVGSTITVTGTEVDGSTTNEGTLGVGAGGANTAVITSNTSGANGVTISGGTNVTISESTASNGGTITINASGGDSGWFKFFNNYVTPTESKPMKFSGSDSLYIIANSFSDTNYLAMSTAYLSDSIDVTAKRYDLILDIDMSLVSSVARLADSTGALRASFPTTIYSGNGTLSAARTISTNGNKLTISGSNTDAILEVNNSATGGSTTGLKAIAGGLPISALRNTIVVGSLVPTVDLQVATSGTAAAGLGNFINFGIEDAGGLNKEAGRIGFRTSDATGSSYDSEAFISVRKDSSELKEGLTLLSTGQLHLKEYGDTLFTGTAVKYLAVADDGKVIEVDGAAGTVKGTGAANKVAIWASADSLYQNTNLHWDNVNGRLGVGTNAPGSVLSTLDTLTNTSGTSIGNNFLTNYNIAANSSGGMLGVNMQTIIEEQNQFDINGGVTGAITRVFNRSVGAINSMVGSNLTVRNQRRGNVNNITGGNFIIANDSIGTIINAYSSLYTAINALSGSTITNLYGSQFSLTNSGTITNTYGFYCGDITAGTQTNVPFSFYAEDANALNYFNGKTGLGVTSPQNRLDVEGGAAIGATYSGTSTAPTNGLLVEGKTLIGTTTGNRPIPLQVVENALIGGHLIGTSSTGTSNIGTLVIGREAYGDSIRTNLGGNHVVVGYRAWQYADNNSGFGSVIIGEDAGSLNVTGNNQLKMSNCVVLGSDARVSSTLGGLTSNQIVIGESARGAGTNTTTIGSTSTTLTHLEGRVRTADYFDHRAPVTVTAATYTVGDATTYIIVNYAGTCNITLPTAADNTGRMLSIKTITANAVNSAVGVNNVVPIDGNVAGNTIIPATDGAWVEIVSDGTNWIVMKKG